MIQIDMDLPQSCNDCPCTHMIQHGEHEGECICSILNHFGKSIPESAICVRRRPPNCPMHEVRVLRVIRGGTDKGGGNT